MDKHLKIARDMTKLLDNQFEILGFKFGLDPIIGLIPFLGDALAAMASAYLLWIGYKLGMPKEKLVIILGYAIFDFALGIVPGLGDFVDVVFKSYQMSLDLIDEHLASFDSKVIEGEKLN